MHVCISCAWLKWLNLWGTSSPSSASYDFIFYCPTFHLSSMLLQTIVKESKEWENLLNLKPMQIAEELTRQVCVAMYKNVHSIIHPLYKVTWQYFSTPVPKPRHIMTPTNLMLLRYPVCICAKGYAFCLICLFACVCVCMCEKKHMHLHAYWSNVFVKNDAYCLLINFICHQRCVLFARFIESYRERCSSHFNSHNCPPRICQNIMIKTSPSLVIVILFDGNTGKAIPNVTAVHWNSIRLLNWTTWAKHLL